MHLTAQQADTLKSQGGGNVGIVRTGSLGEQYTSAKKLTNQKTSKTDAGLIFGKVFISASELPALIKDANNTVYSVDAQGKGTKIGEYKIGYEGVKDLLPDSTSVTVTFSANSAQKYGFDAFQPGYAKRPMMEPHYLKRGDKYYSAKAITPGDMDAVDFEVSGADEDQIVFVNRDGFVFEHSNNFLSSTKGEVSLGGGPAMDAQEVFAIYEKDGKKTLVGALLLASYPVQQKSVVLIITETHHDISEAKRKEMEDKLNTTFGQAGLRYSLSIDHSIADKPWCGSPACASFQPTGSALLSNDYTGDEAKIIDFYTMRAGFTADKDVAYLFAIGAASDPNGEEGTMQGKMNFDKQFGFLYNVQSNSDFATMGRTLAHELGHGQYKLYHIYDPMYLGKPAKHSPNLMSYSSSPNALLLNKLQWDITADPGVTWGIMARDKDQEMLSSTRKPIEFIRLLRLANIHRNVKIPMNEDAGFPLNETADIKIGNNVYQGLKIEKGEVGPFTQVNNIVQGLNVKITLKNNSEASKMMSFLSGTEKNIYGIDNSFVNVQTSDGSSSKITLDVISKTMEMYWVALLQSGEYFKLTEEEKLILDVPILMWNLKLKYGAVFMHNWFLGTGLDIYFTDENKKELFDVSEVYNNNLKNAVEEINSDIGFYEGNYTSSHLVRIKDLIVNPANTNKQISVEIIADYTSKEDQYNCFKFYPVSSLNQSDLFSNNINQDLIASFGSYTLNIVFSGVLEIKGYDFGFISVVDVKSLPSESFS